jgi:excisionase family DNA binding protein
MEALTISVAAACEATGLGRTKIYQLLASNVLKRVKVGRRTLLDINSVRRLVDTNAVPGGDRC